MLVQLQFLSLFLFCVLFLNSTNDTDNIGSKTYELSDEEENVSTIINNTELIEKTTNMFSESSEIENSEEEWVKEVVRDLGYYLRSYKFNGFDRRYHEYSVNVSKHFYASFPKPPLRTLHWEVKKHCEDDVKQCIQYLWSKVQEAFITRSDDSSVVMQEQQRSEKNFSVSIEIIDTECKRLKKLDEFLAKPFQGPIERFQWCTTASYYLCSFVMKEISHFQYFGEQCDNFANCLDPDYGPNNKDPRASDEVPYRCALYSFCPDPCCPLKHIYSFEECWNDDRNPCKFENRNDERVCTFNKSDNTILGDIILNRWNVSCHCSREGFEWSSKYGICIDVNECTSNTHECNSDTESCVNLAGSYDCLCKWGYIREGDECVASDVIESLNEFYFIQNTSENQTEVFSFIAYIKKLFSKIIQ